MRLGQLRHRATIEQLSDQRPDFTGEPLREWEEVAQLRIGFEPEQEMLIQDNDQIERLRVTKAMVRYPGFQIVPTVMRVRSRDTIYNVVSATDVNAQKRWVSLTLKASDDDGS